MGVNSGKFYDATKMRNYCDSMKKEIEVYAENADISQESFSRFHNTEGFKGITAQASKRFIKDGVGKMLKGVSNTHLAMVETQVELITLFENMVDSSQNARIEYDALDIINKDFKNLYYEYIERIENVRRIVNNLNCEFGSYAYFEQPNAQEGIDAFVDFCGGDNESSGFIKECQNKLLAWDEAGKALLLSKETMDKVANINVAIENTKNELNNHCEHESKAERRELESIDNSVAALMNGEDSYSGDNTSYKVLMDKFGFNQSQAMLLAKAINTLGNNKEVSDLNFYKKIAYVYGVLSALCISYDAKRWRLTTGQLSCYQAEKELKKLGFSDQEILDLRVIINLQHGDFEYDTLKKYGMDINSSRYKTETYTKINKRALENNNDFAHMTVQMAAFGNGDSVYENNEDNLARRIVDMINAPVGSDFSTTYSKYEISFKGDIDSGRYSEEDFQSDVDAINIYQRMVDEKSIDIGVWNTYFEEVDDNKEQRAIEFFENIGNGYIDMGIINLSNIIETETYGSIHIKLGSGNDIKKAKQTFVQWIMSIYGGIDYEFPQK